MKLRLALATATAMGVLMGAAFAGENNISYITQTGAANSASIAQSGSNNVAGPASDAMLQNGNSNELTVLQSGSSNNLGTPVNGQGVGVEQTGNTNKASITQSSNFNTVNQVIQTTNAGVVSSLPNANELTITQSGGNSNTVNRARQIASVNGAGANKATITQTGTGNLVGQGNNAGHGPDHAVVQQQPSGNAEPVWSEQHGERDAGLQRQPQCDLLSLPEEQFGDQRQLG